MENGWSPYLSKLNEADIYYKVNRKLNSTNFHRYDHHFKTVKTNI